MILWVRNVGRPQLGGVGQGGRSQLTPAHTEVMPIPPLSRGTCALSAEIHLPSSCPHGRPGTPGGFLVHRIEHPVQRSPQAPFALTVSLMPHSPKASRDATPMHCKSERQTLAPAWAGEGQPQLGSESLPLSALPPLPPSGHLHRWKRSARAGEHF